jgi:hypothetical protein
MTMADYFKAMLGYPNTSVNRSCVGCAEMLPDCAFDVPFTPGRPDLNICRECGDAGPRPARAQIA